MLPYHYKKFLRFIKKSGYYYALLDMFKKNNGFKDKIMYKITNENIITIDLLYTIFDIRPFDFTNILYDYALYDETEKHWLKVRMNKIRNKNSSKYQYYRKIYDMMNEKFSDFILQFF